MRLPEPKRCGSCGASVRWLVTHLGRAMPVDADPVHTGNIVIESDDTTAGVHVRPHDPLLDDPGITRWVSHFATCPNAEQHRRKSSRP